MRRARAEVIKRQYEELKAKMRWIREQKMNVSKVNYIDKILEERERITMNEKTIREMERAEKELKLKVKKSKELIKDMKMFGQGRNGQSQNGS